MRMVLTTILVLLAAAYVATRAGGLTTGRAGAAADATKVTEPADDGWRRTVHGWERCDHWAIATSHATQREAHQVVHPVMVAAVQIGAVLGLWLLTRSVHRPKGAKVRQRTADELARSSRTRIADA